MDRLPLPEALVAQARSYAAGDATPAEPRDAATVVLLRPGAWYRRELTRHFRHMGAGFWLRQGSPLSVWEMDTAG